MTLIAILIGVLVLTGTAASFFALRASVRSVDHLCSEIRILTVSVNGLEALLGADVRMARESSDAAVSLVAQLIEKIDLLEKGPDVETPHQSEARMGSLGRIARIRDAYAALETDSMRGATGG